MNAPASREPDWIAQYHALSTGVALVEFAQRTQIEVSGADRATFLHNLCTNNVRQLEVGAGCEAFLTTVQGKTLAHVFIFEGPESLVIDTVGGQGETILEHLDHYLISEKVTPPKLTGAPTSSGPYVSTASRISADARDMMITGTARIRTTMASSRNFRGLFIWAPHFQGILGRNFAAPPIIAEVFTPLGEKKLMKG